MAQGTDLRELLESRAARFHEIETLLLDPEVMRDGVRYSGLARERGALMKVVGQYEKVKELQRNIRDNQEMADGDDAELAELALEEIPDLQAQLNASTEQLQELLVAVSDDDSKNAILEIRAGTGGDEASLFSADLFKMYSRYADRRKWKLEVISTSHSEVGGFKEVIFCVSGENAFRDLKFEGGGHRVQRVPETESQGRIHTSACTVAVLPEQEEIDVVINPEELRIDTMCSSGPGGQHVNRTESAVRITHLPSNIVVVCQDEKSQRRNRERAMRVLRTRLQAAHDEETRRERGDMRRSMIGSGDRSERIRTYNFPQNRLTDHRVGLTLYSLDKIVLGDLDVVVNKLRDWESATLLEDMGFKPGWLEG